jgi:hypothetical protein
MYRPSIQSDVLHLTRDDGAGYRIRRIGSALIEASWVDREGAPAVTVTTGAEEFLRQRPDVLVSPGCAGAVRALAYG